MTFKDVFYIIIYLLFIAIAVVVFVRSRKEKKQDKAADNKEGGTH